MKTELESISMLPMSELARRGSLAPQTITARLRAAGILPDGELISGSRRSPLFLEARLPSLLRAICSQPETNL